MAPLLNLLEVKLKNWGDQCVVAAILNPVLDKGAFALFCAADVFVKKSMNFVEYRKILPSPPAQLSQIYVIISSLFSFVRSRI